MAKVTGIAAVCVLLLAATGAPAQEMPVRRACAAELQQHCAGVQPGQGRLRDCVQQHFAAFSEPC
ncbi:MAG TPA: cysteine rich repeat-containing protein, partial [Stellaceae bacterium]|nr:cysteine rich repeat-containing protein [Stellaceae bacterium]